MSLPLSSVRVAMFRRRSCRSEAGACPGIQSVPASGTPRHGGGLDGQRHEILRLEIVHVALAAGARDGLRLERHAPRDSWRAGGRPATGSSRFGELRILRGDAGRDRGPRASRRRRRPWCRACWYSSSQRGSLSPSATSAAVPIETASAPSASALATSAPLRMPPETMSCTLRCMPRSCSACTAGRMRRASECRHAR